MTSKVIQGHIRTLLGQNHSSIFVYFDDYEDQLQPTFVLVILTKELKKRLLVFYKSFKEC